MKKLYLTTIIISSFLCSCLSLSRRSQLSSTSRKNFTEKIDFKLDESNRIFIAGFLNGRQTHFLFDTGAMRGLAPADSIKTFKISTGINKQKLYDFSGTSTVSLAKAGIQIGSIPVSNARFAVTSKRPYFCIGNSTINAFNWSINTQKNEIIVSDSFFKPISKKYTVIEYENINAPLVSCTIDELKQEFMVDYGAQRDIYLDSNTEMATYLIQKYAPKPVELIFGGSASDLTEKKTYQLQLPDFAIGGLNVKGVNVMIVEDSRYNLIGVSLLNRFRVLINSNFIKAFNNVNQMIIEEL